ncbi:MAG: aminoacyl-tRNA hydrolase [Bdellovibrionales bacterium]|nr:aminoacyl-tRNA hydrolase [Bdellovibrionales bacterium]
MKLIVGLGNPGKKYLLTPHNIGWIVLDALACHWDLKWRAKTKFQSQVTFVEQENVLLVKPLTYMNLSGSAIKSIIHYYKINLDDILIIHDDTDLPFLSLRFHKNRGPAGHNGLKSINKELGSQNYTRMRVGMGPNTVPFDERQKEPESAAKKNTNKKRSGWLPSLPAIKITGVQFPINSGAGQRLVLKPFTKKEQKQLPHFLSKSIEAIECFLSEGLEKSANRYNSETS